MFHSSGRKKRDAQGGGFGLGNVLRATLDTFFPAPTNQDARPKQPPHPPGVTYYKEVDPSSYAVEYVKTTTPFTAYAPNYNPPKTSTYKPVYNSYNPPETTTYKPPTYYPPETTTYKPVYKPSYHKPQTTYKPSYNHDHYQPQTTTYKPSYQPSYHQPSYHPTYKPSYETTTYHKVYFYKAPEPKFKVRIRTRRDFSCCKNKDDNSLGCKKGMSEECESLMEDIAKDKTKAVSCRQRYFRYVSALFPFFKYALHL